MLGLGIRVVIALVVVLVAIQLLSVLWPLVLCGLVLWVIYKLAR